MDGLVLTDSKLEAGKRHALSLFLSGVSRADSAVQTGQIPKSWRRDCRLVRSGGWQSECLYHGEQIVASMLYLAQKQPLPFFRLAALEIISGCSSEKVQKAQFSFQRLMLLQSTPRTEPGLLTSGNELTARMPSSARNSREAWHANTSLLDTSRTMTGDRLFIAAAHAVAPSASTELKNPRNALPKPRCDTIRREREN